MEPTPTPPHDSPEELDRLAQIETAEADVVEPPPETIRRGSTFESFRSRDFSLFWSGSLVSNTGTWMQTYALSIVVYSLRRSELDLGIVNFLSGIPVLFLAIPAGALADRVDKKRLLVTSQAVLAVQALALWALFAAGMLSSEHAVQALLWIGALGLLAGVMSALTFPAWQALLPELVPRESLLNGIALNSAQFQMSRLLGPLVASTLVVAGLSMGDLFLVNAASFLFVIAALWAISPVPIADPGGRGPRGVAGAGEARPGAWATITAGVRYAAQDRVVGALILSTAFVTVFAMPYMMLLPAVVDKALGGGKLEVSWVMAANGLGAVVGALVVASMPHGARRERLIPFGLFAMGLLLVAFSLSRTLVLTLVISTLAGAAFLFTNSLTNTSIQATVPPHLRGRVMALFIMAFMGIMPISSAIFGPLGQAIGPTNAVFAGAIVLLIWAVFLLLSGVLVRRTRLTGHRPPAP